MGSRVVPVACLLLVSGMCALVFQTAWFREFRLIFGSSTPASAAVLAIFMGGLGLGNAVLGKRADRAANPLLFYAKLEMLISVASMASPILVLAIRYLYISLGGQATLGLTGATVVRVILSALVLGLPTFLMGGTLPAAARAVTSPDDHGRRDVGLLYGLNTLGAVVGCLLSTFFLLEMLGTRATLWAACAVNLLNAVAAWKLAQQWKPFVAPIASAPVVEPKPRRDEAAGKRHGKKEPQPETAAVAGNAAIEEPAAALPPLVLYIAAGLFGFAFFLMELVWYRMLGPILGGTTFTFGLILAVALAGIGIGGALYPLVFRDRRPTGRDFAMTCAWESLAIAIPFALGDRLAVLTMVLRGMAYYGFSGQLIAWTLVALIVIFPAALISGLQFPILIALIGQGRQNVGRHLGQAFAWNTLGAMLGSLGGGFGLLPLLSATGVWQAVVILLACFALIILGYEYLDRKKFGRLLQPLAIVALAIVCITMTGPTAVWRHSGIGAGRVRMPPTTQNDLKSWMNETRRSVAWQADGRESSVAVSTRSGVAFLVNGKSDGNAVSDAATQIMFSVLGGVLHPDPKEALVIGLGTGESAGWLAHLPSMQRVDVVELEAVILRVAEMSSGLNQNVLQNPKVRIHNNDAREALLTSRNKYDLIASEPSNPYRSGVSSLYTAEFYQAARQRLKPGGIFLQWLQGYEIDVPTVRTVLATLHQSFPHIEIWETKPSDMVLVCFAEPPTYDLERLKQKLAIPQYREAVRIGWRTTTVEGVLAHFLANSSYADEVVASELSWPNTDDMNVLEYSFARTVGRSGGFSVYGLRQEAIRAGHHRPTLISSGVDWELVEDHLLAYHVLTSDTPLPPAQFKGDRSKRASAFAAFAMNAPPKEVITQWEAQPRAPVDVAETTILAFAYAETGSDQAKPFIEQLQGLSPLEADMAAAILAEVKGEHASAGQQLERVFLALRRDATPTVQSVGRAIESARRLVEKEPKEAPRLFQALRRPFALYINNDQRMLVLLAIAGYVSPKSHTDVLAEYEPYPIWDRQMLSIRAEAYQQTKSPLAAAARDDLYEYLGQAPDTAVLVRTEKASP